MVDKIISFLRVMEMDTSEEELIPIPDDLTIRILAQVNRREFDQFCEASPAQCNRIKTKRNFWIERLKTKYNIVPPNEYGLSDIIRIVDMLDYDGICETSMDIVKNGPKEILKQIVDNGNIPCRPSTNHIVFLLSLHNNEWFDILAQVVLNSTRPEYYPSVYENDIEGYSDLILDYRLMLNELMYYLIRMGIAQGDSDMIRHIIFRISAIDYEYGEEDSVYNEWLIDAAHFNNVVIFDEIVRYMIDTDDDITLDNIIRKIKTDYPTFKSKYL